MATGTPKLDFAPLRRVRESRGWSRLELAKKAGMHVATIDRIEGNKNQPAINKVLALARALGAPAESLYDVVE